MKKHLQCGLTAALTLALLLTACGQKEADANDTPPDAQAGSLYEDFFTGDVTVTANLDVYKRQAALAALWSAPVNGY